jgi:opacity protein-like surface antigen
MRKNKRYVLCGVFFFLAMSIAAQKAGEKIIFLGFGFGSSFSGADAISGSDLGTMMNPPSSTYWNNADSETSFAYNIGAMFDYFPIDKLALTVGLYYEHTPVKYTYPKRTLSYDFEFTGNFSFLTIPAGVHYFFTDWFFLGGGLYFGLPVNDDVEIELGPASGSLELQTNNDIGLFLDIGGNFAVTENGSVLVSLRYKYGLTKVYDKYDMITNIKMRTFMINVAYGIKL